MLLVINNLCRPDIGQSRVVEQLVHYLEETDKPFTVLRAHSSALLVQLALVLRIAVLCCTRRIRRIYYTPSRAPKSILRDLAVYLASGLDGSRLIVHWHGRDVDIYQAPNRWYIRCCRRILSLAEHICIAEQQATMVRSIWPDASIRIVPNVVEDDFLREVENQLLMNPGEQEKRPARKQVVMIGNLMMSKGIDVFCQLAKTMAGEALDFHLYGPFGSDEEADAGVVADLVDDHAPFVRYHGPAYGPDKVAALLSADVFLFPSRYRSEAMPLVVLEALAAGCWVIASDVGYLNEQNSQRIKVIDLHEGAAMLLVEALRQAPLRDNGRLPLVEKIGVNNFRYQLLSTVLGHGAV